MSHGSVTLLVAGGALRTIIRNVENGCGFLLLEGKPLSSHSLKLIQSVCQWFPLGFF